MQMQSQMNQQAADAAMQAEVQKNQALTENQTQLEQIKSSVRISKNACKRYRLKKELMALEFEYNMQLKEYGG
jgi:hypothetical protein